MDRQTLDTLVRMHQAELYRYVRYLGAERAIAEDLVQETFLAAFRAKRTAEDADPRATASWLRTIARNVYFDYCRASRRDPVRTDAASLERAEAVWSGQFLRDGDGFDYLEALRHCLRGLPERQRRAVELRYARDQSRSEMARLLEMTENGVKSLLRRIRSALAECVRRRLRLGEVR